MRPPAENFGSGITQAGLGPPDMARARAQHAAYVAALERCGLRVVRLDPDSAHPDSTFVEDTVVVARDLAILTRPGAESRRGEVASIRPALASLLRRFVGITDPGTLDGGDVLEAGEQVVIGISERTNEEGARQLAAFLRQEEIPSITLDIRGLPGLLHLKTGIAWIGGDRVLAVRALAAHARVRRFDVVPVPEEEAYAANCILVNGRLILPSGHPRTEGTLRALGYDVLAVEMTEFRKMDGGLSCLSIRVF